MTRKFTALIIEQFKPKSARYEVSDGSVHGLRLIVQPSGAKSWCVRYRHGGRARKLTLQGFPSLPVARNLARAALDQIAQGVDPAAEKRAHEGNLFSTVAEEFLKRHARIKTRASSAAMTERLLKVEVLPAWGDKPIQTITKRDVITLMDTIMDRGAGVTANRVLAAIKTLFVWAISRDIIAVSPAMTVKRPCAEISRERLLDDVEVRKFWLACDALGGPFGIAAKLMLLTGQRRNEVAGMTWTEIDLDKKLWTLPARRTKNGREHVVPLSAEAMSIIDAQPRVSEFVFTANGKKPISGYQRAKKALEGRMGASDWTLHDLRRTAASGMARLGIPVHVTEAVLNHRSGSISGVAAVYNRFDYANEKRTALQAWANFVLATVEGRPANVGSIKARVLDSLNLGSQLSAEPATPKRGHAFISMVNKWYRDDWVGNGD
jgi:integrase